MRAIDVAATEIKMPVMWLRAQLTFARALQLKESAHVHTTVTTSVVDASFDLMRFKTKLMACRVKFNRQLPTRLSTKLKEVLARWPKLQLSSSQGSATRSKWTRPHVHVHVDTVLAAGNRGFQREFTLHARTAATLQDTRFVPKGSGGVASQKESC